MKNGTFSRYLKSAPQFRSVVNAYPDTLISLIPDSLQKYNVTSMMNIPNEDSDTRNYTGSIMSRPIKFGNGLTLKSLRDLKIIMDMNSSVAVTLTLKGSNDLKTWKTLTSFRGIPYKYFKIGLAFAGTGEPNTGMVATDRLTGLATIVQERRTNKLR